MSSSFLRLFVSTIFLSLGSVSVQAQNIPCPKVNIGDKLGSFALDPIWQDAAHQVFDQSDFSLRNEEHLKQLQKKFGMLVHSLPDQRDIYSIQRDLHGYMLAVASREGVVGGVHCGLFVTP